jgi:N-acetyl-anhydromuramyl-L-alanine amidase AmpD
MASSPDHPELNFVQAAGYSKGRPDGPPLWIVIHDMEAGESSDRAESTAVYFASGAGGRQVSSHYCADNNSIIQCVKLADVAWTVGNRPGNNRGINWELAGFARQTRAEWLDPFGRAMLGRMAPYVVADAAKYGIPIRRCTVDDLKAFRPGITSHNDLRLAFGVTTHTDPGPNFPWDVFMAYLEEAQMPITRDDATLIISTNSAPRDRPSRSLGNVTYDTKLTSESVERKVDVLTAEVVAIRALLEGLAGVNPDVAAILAGVDQRLAQLRADIRQDVDDELDEAIPPRPAD